MVVIWAVNELSQLVLANKFVCLFFLFTFQIHQDAKPIVHSLIAIYFRPVDFKLDAVFNENFDNKRFGVYGCACFA